MATADDPPDGGERLRRLAAQFATDSRLDQKVSITAWSEPLEDALARLSLETGVALTFEGRDLGDQRVNVVLKNQPLWRVQTLLAETLDLYWRRERKAPDYRYVLFQDVKNRRREQELLSLGRSHFLAGVRNVVDSLKLSTEEIEKLRGQNPGWAWSLSQPFIRPMIRLAGRRSPAEWQRLIETGKVEIAYRDLSPGDQQLVRQYIDETNKSREERDQQRGTPGMHQLGDVTQPGGKVVFKVFGGVPPGPDSVLDFLIEPADGRGGGSSFGLGYPEDDRRVLREVYMSPGFEHEKRNPPPIGGPRVTVGWKPKEFLPWEEVLKAVAEAADLQVVSDSFLYYWWEKIMDLPDPSALRDRPLAEVLDRITEPFFYAWRRDTDVYLFRQRNWFLEKRHNVPERDLRRWLGHLSGGGRLTLEDTVELALLTDRQRTNAWHRGIPVSSASSHRIVLRLYAALNPFQRTRLATTGLGVGELDADQTELLRAWKPTARLDGDARLRLRREAEAVVFTLASDGTATQEQSVTLDRARQPASN